MEFGDFLSNGEGSDNELTWNDDDGENESTSDDESTDAQNNKVNNKRKFDQNDGGKNNKKLRRDRKVAPPTAEEMIHLRETETLFKSNLFRLEIEQMLKEIKPLKTFQIATNSWIENLKKFCKTLTDDEDWIHVSEVKDLLSEFGVCFPLPQNGKTYDGHYKFLKPLDVRATGSYSVDCTMGPKFNVDIAVIIPKGFFRKKDYLNQTYHYKRALYLCVVAGHLRNSELVSEQSGVKFCCVSGDSLKPVLVVNPRGKAENKVEMILHAIPEDETFKLSRFIPSSNNVRRTWWGCSNMVAELPATPLYNVSILEDIVMESNERIRKHEFKDNKNMKEALCLLRVWLRQRSFDQGFGAFTTYIMSMLLVYLKDKQKINKHMSSYQVIRNVWHYLSQTNWCEEGASMCKGDAGTVPAVSVFHGYFDVVFIDPSGYLNLTARINRLTYLKVRSESAKAIELLDTTEANGFQALFMVKMPFLHQYDHLISFTNEGVIQQTVGNNTSSGSEIDYNGDAVPAFTRLVGDLLVRGLGERAAEVGLMLLEPPRWDISESKPSVMTDVIAFGIRLHPEHALNIIDKGPQANLPEAAEFREFWNSKSELRRFKDGTVCECMVWDTASSLPLSKRFGITKKVCSFLLQTKLGINHNDYIYVSDQLHHVITPKLHDVAAEEACVKIHKSLEELSRQLVELDKLPLEVTSVHCISASYRYAEVFPPLPPQWSQSPHSPLSSTFTPGGRTLVDNPHRAPPFIPTIDLVLQMTFTRRWPDDLTACRRLTAAFYIAIGNKLLEKHKLKFLLHSDCLIIQKDGFMFRLFLGYSKEISLLKLNITNQGVKQYKDTPESVELEKMFINLPKMTGALHGLSVAEAGFGGGARLVKRWIYAHMLDSYHFPPIIAELMVASLLLSPQPYSTLLQPQQIFLRFLHMMATTNWNTELLIINFNKLLSKDEMNEIERKFSKERSSFPPLVIVTPYDTTGSLWTRKSPTLSTLIRLAKLASATLSILQLKLLTSNPHDQYVSIFTPNLDLYDVVLKLNMKMVPRMSEKVTWKVSKAALNSDKNKKTKSIEMLPVTNFDPPQLYLECLRENYDEFALFFHDPCGGSSIGVLFKPTTFGSSDFKVNAMGGRCPDYDDDPVSLKTNFRSLINDFRELGEGIVEDITYSVKIKQLLKS